MTTDKLRQQILSQLADLQALCASSAGARATVMLDQSRVGRLSRMDALQAQAMAQQTSVRHNQQIQRLQHALQRLDNDQYGFCQTCDEAIVPARLAIDPAVELCINCASQTEQ